LTAGTSTTPTPRSCLRRHLRVRVSQRVERRCRRV
jgi:hypothetical protein